MVHPSCQTVSHLSSVPGQLSIGAFFTENPEHRPKSTEPRPTIMVARHNKPKQQQNTGPEWVRQACDSRWIDSNWRLHCLERNQSKCVLFDFVQGRRSLGSRRLEFCGFGIHQLWFRSRPRWMDCPRNDQSKLCALSDRRVREAGWITGGCLWETLAQGSQTQ